MRISAAQGRRGHSEVGRACPLCPGNSDVNLFRYGEGVVDLDAEIAHGACYVTRTVCALRDCTGSRTPMARTETAMSPGMTASQKTRRQLSLNRVISIMACNGPAKAPTV